MKEIILLLPVISLSLFIKTQSTRIFGIVKDNATIQLKGVTASLNANYWAPQLNTSSNKTTRKIHSTAMK